MTPQQSPIITFPHACPCCGYRTLDGRGEYEICTICWWEDDGQDNHNANVVCGGPNGKLSLTRARINFAIHGIFCPSRTDLRDKQESIESYHCERNFTYDLTTRTFFDHDSDWTSSVFELDDNPEKSRFEIGDSVIYRRRDLDLTNESGTIKSTKWNTNIDVWQYRLLDYNQSEIGKWFDGAKLEPEIAV